MNDELYKAKEQNKSRTRSVIGRSSIAEAVSRSLWWNDGPGPVEVTFGMASTPEGVVVTDDGRDLLCTIVKYSVHISAIFNRMISIICIL